MICQRISLALGGGGARGVAHLGVMEGLLRSGLEIERLAGISIGSLAGALYAFDPDIRRVQRQILEYLASSAFQQHQRRLLGSHGPGKKHALERESWWLRLTSFLRANSFCRQMLRNSSLLAGDVLRHACDSLLPDADIASARIPLSIVAVDLLEGVPVILENGPVRGAVRASASIPGVFPPVEFDGRLLCDIGVLNSLPTLVSRTYQTGCWVAVDVSSALQPIATCPTAVDVLMRINDIGENMFRRHVSNVADLIIRPDVGDIPWFDFSAPSRLIERGREAVLRALPRIRERCCAPSSIRVA
ncbi:MAG: patatin-like phospholipase family protein [Planctomycetes bacterium]|nr:patatin-like phospholipase family protein [Planctomycetia bacterium]MBI3464690.1 patatin-like phospholipase family protein [Planctomycetota bacterium]